MNDINYAPVCGVYCGDCNFLGKECTGCGYVAGKPFWSKMMPSKICPLYDCCRNKEDLEHCGLCDKFPCKTFLELRDPNMSDEEFIESLKTRQEALKRRTEIGTEKWLLENSSSQ